MENETDVIREQMLETRTALTEKLEALQETVVDAVTGTTESVTETVQSVKDAVQDTVTNVSETVHETVETVKSTFDIGKQVENHPWAMLGGAVALGFLTGKLLPSSSTVMAAGSVFRGTRPSSNFHSSSAPANFANTGYEPRAQSSAPSQAPRQESGLLKGLTEALQPAIKQVEGMAIGALAGVIGEMAMRAAPEGFKPQIKELIQTTTASLGGTPMDCSGLFNGSESSSTEHQSSERHHA